MKNIMIFKYIAFSVFLNYPYFSFLKTKSKQTKKRTTKKIKKEEKMKK